MAHRQMLRGRLHHFLIFFYYFDFVLLVNTRRIHGAQFSRRTTGKKVYRRGFDEVRSRDKAHVEDRIDLVHLLNSIQDTFACKNIFSICNLSSCYLLLYDCDITIHPKRNMT